MKISAKCSVIALSMVNVATWCCDAFSAENGQTHANLGYLDFLAGFMPPPGFYFRDDVIGVPSNSLNDRNGSQVKLGGVLPGVPKMVDQQSRERMRSGQCRANRPAARWPRKRRPLGRQRQRPEQWPTPGQCPDNLPAASSSHRIGARL